MAALKDQINAALGEREWASWPTGRAGCPASSATPRPSCGAAWTARHGLRTLIKRGHPHAPALAGATVDADVRLIELALERDRVPVGGTAAFAVTLELAASDPAEVVVDYGVHYVGTRGVKAPRVSSSHAAGSSPAGR